MRLIEPQIMSTQLRTRSAFQAGGSLGLATPNISGALNALGLPSLFTVRGDNYSRREAFVEIFHPMQGIQLTTGIRRGEVAEGGLAVGPTWKTPGGLINARATLGGRIGSAGSGVDGVVLRIRREGGGCRRCARTWPRRSRTWCSGTTCWTTRAPATRTRWPRCWRATPS